MTILKLITAICTPLTPEEDLHVEGLEAHIHDQLENEINGLLVAGTMGAMQLLKTSTYQQLVSESLRINAGQAEFLVGVGDAGYARTLERIQMVEHLPIDGVVVLAPYFFKFTQDDLIDYFRALADASSKPVFLYDLPGTTGTKLELKTVRKLAQHPNIAGVKCSDQFTATRPLLDAEIPDFRVIVAQPLLLDILLKAGVQEHLDGLYGFAPHWMKEIRKAYERQDWETVSSVQRDFAELLSFLVSLPAPLFSSVSELLNLRGIPGCVSPRPMRPVTASERDLMLQSPIVQKAIAHEFVTAHAGEQ